MLYFGDAIRVIGFQALGKPDMTTLTLNGDSFFHYPFPLAAFVPAFQAGLPTVAVERVVGASRCKFSTRNLSGGGTKA
jgi:hypothetical protein